MLVHVFYPCTVYEMHHAIRTKEHLLHIYNSSTMLNPIMYFGCTILTINGDDLNPLAQWRRAKGAGGWLIKSFVLAITMISKGDRGRRLDTNQCGKE